MLDASLNAYRCSPFPGDSFYQVEESYLVDGDDLAVRLLDLSQLRQEVPESALGDDLVGGEDAHAVELGGGVGVGGEETSHDLVFLKATCTAVWY